MLVLVLLEVCAGNCKCRMIRILLMISAALHHNRRHTLACKYLVQSTICKLRNFAITAKRCHEAQLMPNIVFLKTVIHLMAFWYLNTILIILMTC